MIDGLKLTLSGQELRTLLDEGIQRHRATADRWSDEASRTDDSDGDGPVLPRHMSEHEAERHTWRAEVLTFIRDHVDPRETYCLGATDLEYGELLPEKPGWVQQDDYEERTRIGFTLERLVKAVDESTGLMYALLRRGTSREASGEREEPVSDADGWGSSAPAGIKALALVSTASWTCAVVSGRLIAYY